MKSARSLPVVAFLFHVVGRTSGFAPPAAPVAGSGPVRPCVGRRSTRQRSRASAPGEYLFREIPTRTSLTTTTSRRRLSDKIESARNDPAPNEARDDGDDENPLASGSASIARTASQVKEFLTSKRGALAAAAATAILVLSLVLSPLGALAVQSGGRMGGGSFSSGGSSRSSSSSSYSRPSAGGYSTGYGRGYRSGVSAGYYSRPNVVVSPSPWFTPWSYNPWGWGYARPGVVVSTGPGLFGFLVFGGFALAAAAAISSFGRSVTDSASGFASTTGGALGDGASVVRLSVALDVPDRESSGSILTVLSRLAETARTDSRVGIQNLTSQVALELLRRKQSIVAASSKYDHYRNVDRAQRDFNNLAVRERGKFERETISKYRGVDYSEGGDARSLKPGEFAPRATMAVVTILIAIEGDSTKVSRIGSIGDVEEALSRIASDSKVDDCLKTAEILWTPTEPTETLTRREVFADYPDLRSV